MKIRFAQKEDIKSVVKLCKEHAEYEKATYSEQNKEFLLHKYLFENLNEIKCIVAELDNEIVGYATFLKQFSTWEVSYYIYLDCLYLKEKVRGNRIGFQMMELIREYAKSEKCSIIQWQTPNFNDIAINFYNKIGAKAKLKERFFWTV